MNQEKNSSEIDQVKQVLAKSFDGSEGDDIPPMPDGLRDRIEDQYGRAASDEVVRDSGESFFSLLSQLFRKPAFAVGMAAVIMLVVGTALLNRPTGDPGFRGPGSSTEVRLVLHQVDAATVQGIESAGIDRGAMVVTASADELGAALDRAGVRIVIDGRVNKLFGYLPGASEPSLEEDLPSDPSVLAAKVAEVQGKLTK